MEIKEKLKTREQLKPMCERWRKEGKKVGFTSGAFDIIHAGHAAYLEKAKAMCDILIVGVNTDNSIKKYKGDNRPIIPEKDRLWLIAGLGSVDYAFLFDERRNQTNIEEIKPHYYIKAGDYKAEELTSKEIVEKHGGKVVLIPLEFKISSSDIINKIAASFGADGSDVNSNAITEGNATHIKIRINKTQRAILLDRDGTINKDIEYLHEPEKFEFLPNAIEGMKKLQAFGFRLAIITTQAGIGLGYFTKEDFYKVNREMFKQLAPHNVVIDRIYFCPHSLGDKCDCRKPGAALIEQAKTDLNLDLKGSYMIGDKSSDIEAGKRAGCKTILVSSKTNDKEYSAKPDKAVKDLFEAAEYILKQERRL